MADLQPRSALADHWRPGRRGAAAGEPGVVLEERVVGAMAQLSGVDEPGALREALASHAPVGDPQPLRASSGDGLTVLWSGPGQYLVCSERHRGAALATELGAALASSGGAAVDLSHARTLFVLSGPACREVLAKGCPIDVDAMGPGDCAPTLLSHLAVLVHCEDDDRFMVSVTRSFAVSALEWLERAALEFGLELRDA